MTLDLPPDERGICTSGKDYYYKILTSTFGLMDEPGYYYEWQCEYKTAEEFNLKIFGYLVEGGNEVELRQTSGFGPSPNDFASLRMPLFSYDDDDYIQVISGIIYYFTYLRYASNSRFCKVIIKPT